MSKLFEYIKTFVKWLRVSELAALISAGVLIATGAAVVAKGAPFIAGFPLSFFGLLTLGFVVNASYERGLKDGFACCLHTICNGKDIEIRHVHETGEPKQ
jgi:hypothetical protein